MIALQILTSDTQPVFLDMPVPVADLGSVVVKIAACGLNFADTLMIRGTYQNTPTPPFTLGLEFSGKVVDLGAGVTDLNVGDRVACFNGQGGLAEYATVPATRCIKLADAVDFEAAAGSSVTYGTAHIALRHRAKLRPHQVVLITGAAGGTGLAAVEMAKAMGAQVWAMARGGDKSAVAHAAGADHCFDSDDPDLLAQLKAKGGADVVFDTVGGDGFETCFRACKPGGQFLIIGFAGGAAPQIPANIALVKNITLHGVNWPGILTLDPDLFYQSLSQVFEMVAQGQLTPKINHRYAFKDAIQAIADLKTRKTTGKAVVTFP